MRKKNKITEQKIIYRYLNKLNFNKSETFNFNNDAAFLKKRKNIFLEMELSILLKK